MLVHRHDVIQLLQTHQCKRFGEHLGADVWVTPSPNNVVIRLPLEDRVHIDIVEVIALEQLNMSTWEYDYWLGQIGFQI